MQAGRARLAMAGVNSALFADGACTEMSIAHPHPRAICAVFAVLMPPGLLLQESVALAAEPDTTVPVRVSTGLT
jgi:hypothetical protein